MNLGHKEIFYKWPRSMAPVGANQVLDDLSLGAHEKDMAPEYRSCAKRQDLGTYHKMESMTWPYLFLFFS